ncbi:glycoside hydrolase family protein [Polaribacter sp. M15]
MIKNVLVILSFFVFSVSNSQIVTYKAAPNISDNNPYIFESPYYKVELSQNAVKKPTFVYGMNAMHTTNNSKSTSWVNFSFDGEVTVKVTVLYKQIDFAQILPRSSNIAITILDKNTISFSIKKPGHFSVEFEKGIFIEHPLLIFANPLEKNTPKKEDKNVVYFEAGFHEIGDNFKVASNTHIYLEGGAYVKGQIVSKDVKNVKISGRGILSGEDYEPRTHNHMIQIRDANNVEIEGLTIIHSPRYMIATSGKKHFLHNLKMMGWWFSTDGISAGEDTLIENCFFKVNDDAIKLYRTNTKVRNCVIWQLENGAPFMISWNGSKDFGNINVDNIEVIRVEHHWDNENLAVFCAVHGGQAHISNFVIKNITIDNSKWRIFHLVTRPNRWGKWNPQKGKLSDFTFKNIHYFGEQKIPSLIMGHDEFHPIENILFENIVINGAKKATLKSFLILDKNTTKNIKIK